MRFFKLACLALLITVSCLGEFVFAAPSVEIYDLDNECLTQQNAERLLPGTRVDHDKDDYSRAAAETLSNAYWFYKHYFDRNSFDDQGIALKVSIHARFGFSGQCNGNNAMYDNNNKRFMFGDGDGEMMSMPGGAFDLVAHEFTHGVTHTESNLTYKDESGAINEALSDIFGVSAEIWKESGGSEDGNPDTLIITADSYSMGESMVPAGSDSANKVIRLLNDPSSQTEDYPDTYPEFKSTLYINGQEVCTKDYGCVHFNMSLLSLAFNLLAEGGTHPQNENDVQVNGIGLDKALEIYYHASTNTFTSSTDHKQARSLLANSAKTIYGECSPEWHGVQRSFDAIEVPGDWTPCGDATDTDTGDTTSPDNDDNDDTDTTSLSSDNEMASELYDMASSVNSSGSGIGSMIQGILKGTGDMVQQVASLGAGMADNMISMMNMFGGGNTSFGKFLAAGQQICKAGMEICKDVFEMMGRIGEMIVRMAEMSAKMFEVMGQNVDIISRLDTGAQASTAAMQGIVEYRQQQTTALNFNPDPASLALFGLTMGQDVERDTAPEFRLSSGAESYRLYLSSTPLMDPDGVASVEVSAELSLDQAWSQLSADITDGEVFLAARIVRGNGWSELSNVVRLSLTTVVADQCDSDHPELCVDETSCQEQGLNWCDSSCQQDECPQVVEICSPEHPELCGDESSCQEQGLNWCDTGCEVSDCADDPVVNLALWAQVRSSSYYGPSWVPTNLVDNNQQSNWVSRPLYSPYQEEWLTLELAEVSELKQLVIHWNGDGFAREFAVFIGQNGQWQMVAEQVKLTAGSTVIELPNSSTSSVLIRMRNGYNMRWFDINEVELW